MRRRHRSSASASLRAQAVALRSMTSDSAAAKSCVSPTSRSMSGIRESTRCRKRANTS
jgi:hypothetical protein